MSGKIRDFYRRLLDTVSNLVHHLRRGYAGEYSSHSPSRLALLETSFRLTGVSARYCRESLSFLCEALRYFGHWLKSYARCAPGRSRMGTLASQPPQGQTSRSETDSYPPSDVE